jgi:hypothetical protein
MRVCIVIEPVDPAVQKRRLFAGFVQNHLGEEMLHIGQVGCYYIGHDFLLTREEAETKALILAAKRPEFIGRLSILPSDTEGL